MVKYLIYVGVALLVVWSAWYLIRHFGKKDCLGCGGDCAHCSKR